MKRAAIAVIGLAVLAAGACNDSRSDPRAGQRDIDALFARSFSHPIVDTAGKRIGTVTSAPDTDGVVVKFAVAGLAPGRHGIHLHEVGRCDPPDFASAGGHWETRGRKHGHDNPQGPHDGDWDNLEVGADGRGATDRLIPRWHGTIPRSGLALVIHAREDDEATDPDGNSGERIACGVVLAPATKAAGGG